MSVRKWIVVSGLSWLVIGAYLMVKGLKWITVAMQETPALLKWLVGLAGSVQQGALILISAALLVGFIKGRMVLSKSVSRIVSHLRSQKGKIQMSNAYDRKYYMILAAMMGIGMLFRFLPIPNDIRGFVDVTIGSALMNGAMLYFRQALFNSAAKL